MLLESVYQEFITEMIAIQTQYYIPLLFISLIVMASVLMYKKKVKSKSSAQHLMNTSLSSLSSINTYHTNNGHNTSSKPNQKYRKQDPETRYDDDGTRYQCVSIPYRIVDNSKVEVFMITSRNRGDYIYPGGGWEKRESGPECAQREAWEEAGIRGNVTCELVSDQHYTSEKGNKSRLWGYLLEVTVVSDKWPETERRRKWMTINEAEIALSERRRIKFGALWKKAIQYFIEHNLYNSSDHHRSEDSKSQEYDHRKGKLHINKI